MSDDGLLNEQNERALESYDRLAEQGPLAADLRDEFREWALREHGVDPHTCTTREAQELATRWLAEDGDTDEVRDPGP